MKKVFVDATSTSSRVNEASDGLGILVSGPNASTNIRAHYGNGLAFGVPVYLIHQQTPHALRTQVEEFVNTAREYPEANLAVLSSDNAWTKKFISAVRKEVRKGVIAWETP